MSRDSVISELEEELIKKDVTDFAVGDTVSVHQRIIEGDKERVQVFTGTVIARTGKGVSETFSVHRVAYGEGMERVFLLHSPRIAKIEVKRRGKARRAKLYNLRGTSGKAAKVKELLGGRSKSGKEAAQPVEEAAPIAEEAPPAEEAPAETES